MYLWVLHALIPVFFYKNRALAFNKGAFENIFDNNIKKLLVITSEGLQMYLIKEYATKKHLVVDIGRSDRD